MLREQAKSIEKLVASVDFLLVLASFLAANLLADRYPLPHLVERFGLFLVAASLVWLLVLRLSGFYHSLRTQTYASLMLRTAQAAALAAVLNAALLFLSAPYFSRRVYILHLGFALGLVLGWKVLIRFTQRKVRARGYNLRHILVVGTRDAAAKLIRHIEEHRSWGYQILGCVQGLNGPEKSQFSRLPVLGRLDRLLEICKEHPVDEVIFTLPRDYLDRLEGILPRLEAMGITVRLTLDYYRPRKSRTTFGLLGEEDPLPIITYHRSPLDPTQLLLKRLLDVAGSLVGLALAALLFPWVALAIKLDGPGPLLFGQKRVGQNGRTFTCYKFRTMSVDAEARKQELMAQNEMKGAIFKMANDPRITRVGRFLRKTSIDELPQFWNVLKGEMSLVGTRPPTPDEVAQYEEWHRGRICIKPGLTGMWQTSGRNRVDDFDAICKLDLSYIDNWSIATDLKLLAKTVSVVLLGVGAR